MKCNADTGRRTTTTTRQRYSNGTATLSELDAMHPPTTALCRGAPCRSPKVSVTARCHRLGSGTRANSLRCRGKSKASHEHSSAVAMRTQHVLPCGSVNTVRDLSARCRSSCCCPEFAPFPNLVLEGVALHQQVNWYQTIGQSTARFEVPSNSV